MKEKDRKEINPLSKAIFLDGSNSRYNVKILVIFQSQVCYHINLYEFYFLLHILGFFYYPSLFLSFFSLEEKRKRAPLKDPQFLKEFIHGDLSVLLLIKSYFIKRFRNFLFFFSKERKGNGGRTRCSRRDLERDNGSRRSQLVQRERKGQLSFQKR